MSTDTSAGELKRSRVKLGAVAVLALILGYLLLKPDGRSPTSTAAVAPRIAGTNNSKSRNVEKPAAIPARPLPEISVAEIAQYNPFEFDGLTQRDNEDEAPTTRPPVEAANAKRDKRLAEQRLRASLTGRFADVILESSRGRSARIGPHIVRQGHRLGDGVKVDRIGDSSVILHFEHSRPAPQQTP